MDCNVVVAVIDDRSHIESCSKQILCYTQYRFRGRKFIYLKSLYVSG